MAKKKSTAKERTLSEQYDAERTNLIDRIKPGLFRQTTKPKDGA